MEALAGFLCHPNQWIRQGAKQFLEYLQDPKNKILTSAEAYCLVRPVVKKAMKQAKLLQNVDENLSRFNISSKQHEFKALTPIDSD